MQFMMIHLLLSLLSILVWYYMQEVLFYSGIMQEELFLSDLLLFHCNILSYGDRYY